MTMCKLRCALAILAPSGTFLKFLAVGPSVSRRAYLGKKEHYTVYSAELYSIILALTDYSTRTGPP